MGGVSAGTVPGFLSRDAPLLSVAEGGRFLTP